MHGGKCSRRSMSLSLWFYAFYPKYRTGSRRFLIERNFCSGERMQRDIGEEYSRQEVDAMFHAVCPPDTGLSFSYLPLSAPTPVSRVLTLARLRTLVSRARLD
jgi:hypothetical protein